MPPVFIKKVGVVFLSENENNANPNENADAGHDHTTNMDHENSSHHSHTERRQNEHTSAEHQHKELSQEHNPKEKTHLKFWNNEKSWHSGTKEVKSNKSVLQLIIDNKKIIIILIMIFLLAFGIRGHLLRYTYLFEFDAFYHARVVEELVMTGSVAKIDPLAYYEIAGGAISPPVSLYHVVSAGLYKIVSLGQPFNKELLMWSIQFFPVIFGSLIAILMYFLGKEVFNSRKIGLITAFVTAVTPAFAYRTMAGAQGDNSFGFIWFVLGMIFLVRTTKTKGMDKWALINAALSGLMFGLMAMSWSMYLMIPIIIIAYLIIGLIVVASKESDSDEPIFKRESFAFALKMFISILVFHILCTIYGENWVADSMIQISVAISHIGIGLDTSATFWLLTILSIVVAGICIFFISKMKNDSKKLILIIAIILSYIILFALFFAFLTVPDLIDRTTISSMVGEESIGNQFFGTKYNSLIVFPWVAIILFPICLYIFRKEDSHTGLIFFFWILLTLFMAWYKLKFTFVFGLAIAPAAAIVGYMLLEGLKKFNMEKGIEAKIIIGTLLLLVLFGVGASARFFPDYVPFVDQNPQWQNAIDWINTNTPADAKLFNWWDQGHIISFLTERKVTTDNRNYSGAVNQKIADFIITTDINYGYTIAAKEFGSDYLVLDSTMFEGAGSFAYYQANSVDSKFAQKYYNGPINIMNCVDNNGAINIVCGGNSIPRAQWNAISSKWKSTPDDFQNGTIPVYYYRTNDQLLVLNKEVNNTNLAKIWMNSDETNKYYETAYNKGGIAIFKIKK
ncbi:MAG: glycosyltransferase family 39 protein [Candidatus Diapherotrites archaeon]|nr:glycosyltransferase family 39 protein [Candidatus Diapherotrites archaeon]